MSSAGLFTFLPRHRPDLAGGVRAAMSEVEVSIKFHLIISLTSNALGFHDKLTLSSIDVVIPVLMVSLTHML
jgi:hypothetical protein